MSITYIIIIVTVLISFTSFNRPDQFDKLCFWPYEIREKNQWYRFITVGFVHSDFNHLLFNMLTLYFFKDVETIFAMVFGSKLYFPLLYLTGLIMPNISDYFKYKNVFGYRAVGASGAVTAVVFSAILFQPWAMIWFVIPFIVYGILFLVYSAYMSRRESNIGHSAHFWGAVWGLLFPLMFKPEIFNDFIQQLLAKFN